MDLEHARAYVDLAFEIVGEGEQFALHPVNFSEGDTPWEGQDYTWLLRALAKKSGVDFVRLARPLVQGQPYSDFDVYRFPGYAVGVLKDKETGKPVPYIKRSKSQEGSDGTIG